MDTNIEGGALVEIVIFGRQRNSKIEGSLYVFYDERNLINKEVIRELQLEQAPNSESLPDVGKMENLLAKDSDVINGPKEQKSSNDDQDPINSVEILP